VEANAPYLNVTGEVLKTKAIEFRNKLFADFSHLLTAIDILAFQAFVTSDGWLEKYLKREGISSRRRCGKHSSVNPATIEKRLQKIRVVLKDITLENILNIDECALHH
jgi:hypothetical protein